MAVKKLERYKMRGLINKDKLILIAFLFNVLTLFLFVIKPPPSLITILPLAFTIWSKRCKFSILTLYVIIGQVNVR